MNVAQILAVSASYSPANSKSLHYILCVCDIYLINVYVHYISYVCKIEYFDYVIKVNGSIPISVYIIQLSIHA